MKSKAPLHPCAACNKPLTKALEDQTLATPAVKRLKQIPANQVLNPKAASTRSVTGSSDEVAYLNERSDQSNVSENGMCSPQSKGASQTMETALNVTESGVSQNVSHVSQNSINVSNTKQDPWSRIESEHITSNEKSLAADTILNVESSKPKPMSASGKGKLKVNLRIVGGSGTFTKRIRKIGRRKLKDIQKRLFASKSQVMMFALFLVCIGIILLLLSAEDDALPVAEKNVDNDLMLPNVRVNPLLLADFKERRGDVAHN